MRVMQIGRLRHRVTIEHRTLSQDDHGAAIRSWADVISVWAEVRTPAGIERFAPEVDQVKATLTHSVRIRGGLGTFTPGMRVLWGTRTLEVVSVTDPDGRGEAQVLLCTEIVEVD